MSQIDIGADHVLVNHWLRGLSAKTGLQLHLNEQGVCAIGHTSGLDCAIEVPDGRGRVYLHIPLMPWAGSPASLAEHCLGENFLGINTDGASFAIDREEGQIVAWITRRLETLTEVSFCTLIVDFFETAAERRRELEEFCRREATQDNPHLEREQAFLRG